MEQVPWTRTNNIGHSFYLDPDPIDQPVTMKIFSSGKIIDHTESFGAFDSIMRTYSLGRRTLDLGGGQFDYNTAYLSERYQVTHRVYDPFKRTKEHNSAVLQEARERPFDTVTSISILNVISTQEALRAHIVLARDSVKDGGKVFFKVWPNNGSGRPSHLKEEGWQSNRRLHTYVSDIEQVFGSRVALDKENQLIWAVK